MAPTEARTALGDEAVIGVSTHNLTQLRAALEAPVDYIALGPVFGTSTKQNPEPTVGLAVVEQAVRALEGDYRPLVLIGGITMERLPELRRIAPRAFYAVIGDVLRSPSIEARVRAYRAELGAK
jgi:thiamine-phosphate pyrophosphorylase